MPPKKKGGKKAADDWDDGLGETPDPIAEATQQAKEEEAANDKAAEEVDPDEEFGGGGLMAALKRNRGKKVKKGKKVQDFDEDLGEDPPGAGDGAQSVPGEAGTPDLESKAPEEADAEDLFGPAKGKPGKGKPGGKQQAKGKAGEGDDDEDEDENGEGGGVKSKKQKEKEKKEREKARKKDQVGITWILRSRHRS